MALLPADGGGISRLFIGRFTLLQWMLGFNIAITLAVLWLLFKLTTA